MKTRPGTPPPLPHSFPVLRARISFHNILASTPSLEITSVALRTRRPHAGTPQSDQASGFPLRGTPCACSGFTRGSWADRDMGTRLRNLESTGHDVMRTRDKVLLGAAAGAGVVIGA